MNYKQMEDQEDLLPVLEVRILDSKRKSSFKVRRLTDFPIAESMKELKSVLSKYMPDLKHVENCQLGYVLERNKKYSIGTDAELQKAYEHFEAGYQMWLDLSPGKIPDNVSNKQVDGKIAGE